MADLVERLNEAAKRSADYALLWEAAEALAVAESCVVPEGWQAQEALEVAGTLRRDADELEISGANPEENEAYSEMADMMRKAASIIASLSAAEATESLRTQLATVTRESDAAVAREAVMYSALGQIVGETARAAIVQCHRAEALLRVVEAAQALKFGAYPAHGSGFVVIVTEGNVDDLADALRAYQEGSNG